MVPSVRPASTDDSLFQVTLNLGDHSSSTPSSPIASSASGRLPQDLSRTQPVTMTIYLAPSFPEVPPRITIFPTVRHLWVDGSVHPAEVTGHEKLKPEGWFTYANLGALIKELVDSIQQTGVLADPHQLNLTRTGSGVSNNINSLAGTLSGLQLNNNNSNSSHNSSQSYHHHHHHLLHHQQAKQSIGSHVNSNGSDSINNGMMTPIKTRHDQNPPSYEDYSHKPPPPIPARTNSHPMYGNNSAGLGKNNNGKESIFVGYVILVPCMTKKKVVSFSNMWIFSF